MRNPTRTTTKFYSLEGVPIREEGGRLMATGPEGERPFYEWARVHHDGEELTEAEYTAAVAALGATPAPG